MNGLWTFLELERRNEHKMLTEKSARITATQKELGERCDQTQRDFLMLLDNESGFFTDDFVTGSSAKIFCEILQQKD